MELIPVLLGNVLGVTVEEQAETEIPAGPVFVGEVLPVGVVGEAGGFDLLEGTELRVGAQPGSAHHDRFLWPR